MKKDFKKNKNRGMAMLTSVIFFLFISLAIISGLVLPSVREFRNANMGIHSKESYFLAESGMEDAFYRIINNMTIGNSETLTLNSSTATTTITDVAADEKQITSIGDTDSYQRKVGARLTTGVGVLFNYGIQTGAGGFLMDNGSQIIGSVYSNGAITGSGTITGSATSANSAALASDQSNGSGIPTYDVSFGNANGTQDFAQSFQVSATDVVNKVDLYLKKVGNPSNLTVRIVNDNNGVPSAVTKASGSLSASTVSTNYGWVSVPFSSNPQLNVGTTYWIVVDASTSASNYYKIGGNDNGYANGVSKIGQYNGSWNNNSPSTVDGFFNLYLGGTTGLIDGITVGTTSNDHAYAHTVTDADVSGTIYCKVGSGNNKSCNTSRSDPTQLSMPISDQNIQDWKDAATAGGVHSGNYVVDDTTATLGPKQITGNLTVDNGGELTVTGIIWVQGNLIVNNNGNISLDPSFGTADGIIIVDGIVTINNNATFNGSGTAGSYMTVLTTSYSSSAITLSNNAGAVALYAANGTIDVANNGTAKSLIGYYIHLNNNAIITYDNGITNANFSSGPSGSYHLADWGETE
jgi:hypothetical protein